ncbi:putative odorant receptor 92a [Phymastichus coffea]|uniref:putative odorant receptor 92a n=1 Tax=Phymastichus coffea TaxID=108790 RepID=UPI00273B3941|nr:putative odorant receptor 92a [Phymastichus coffea]
MATTILPFHFNLLTWFSVRCLIQWPTSIKLIYRIYSLIMFTSLISLNIFQVAKLFFVKLENFSDFNSLFTFNLALQAGMIKAMTFLFNEEKVDRLINMFEEDCCLAQDLFEKNIRKVYEDKCIKLAKIVFFCFEILMVSFVTTPLAFDIELRVLPYPVHLPYSLSNLVIYWLTYADHVINCIYLGHVSLLGDLISTSFMWHLCGQLEILKHRLQKLNGKVSQFNTVSFEKQIMKECIQHHVHLYDIADAIYAAFSICIVFQFYCDALAVCMSVYQLTTMTAGVMEKLAFLSYVGMMLGRLYLVCYFGNEVVSEDLADAIFQIDWTPLSTEVKKSLLMMIIRTSKPIIVSSRFFVRLMLETFIKVVKVSYSGYSLLKSSV